MALPMKSKVAQILLGGIDKARLELEYIQSAHADEVQQLRALVLAAERDRDTLAADNGRLDRENDALVAILCEQGWPAERIADEVERRLGVSPAILTRAEE